MGEGGGGGGGGYGLKRGGVEAWEEETSKTRGKSDPLVHTKPAVGFRDKGNAIHHVTLNATRASPCLAPFSFSLHSNFIRSQCHNKHWDQRSYSHERVSML